MGWTNPRQHAIHHQAPNPLPVKNGNGCHCSYQFELSYFTLLWRLLHKYKSQELYFSCWPVSKRTEARHHALHCNLSLWLPLYIDDYALLVVATPARDMPKLTCKWGPCSCNEHAVAEPRSPWGFVPYAPKLTWCRAKAWLSHRHWEDSIKTPVLLLYEHWDGTGEPPSPVSHEYLSYHADSNQLGEITAVSASQLLMYFVAAPKPQNRKLTAAIYLNQMYRWVLTLASPALDWTPDVNLPYGQ